MSDKPILSHAPENPAGMTEDAGLIAAIEGPSDFRKEMEGLINRYSMENGSDTPDFILAEYLVDCLATFDRAVSRRTSWYKPAAIESKQPA